jgi:mono/diheme cytochrome c family protein
VATDVNEEAVESRSEQGDERSFFAWGALIGLLGGTVIALLLISVGGSVVSLVDDVFGSSTAAEAAPTEELTDDALLVATGEDLATTNGCIACHSSDGLDGVGPSWSGLAGSDRLFEGGGSAIADDAYLTKSILEPNTEIVQGFLSNIMPETYGTSLPVEDIDALIAYINSL